MKKITSFKILSIFFIMIFCVIYVLFGCSANKESTKNEQKVTESQINANKSDATKVPKEIKVSKPNEGGLKQELNTKAVVSTTDKNQVTFEVPTNQLQGLKVGDSLVINSGSNVYPAKILTVPVNNIPKTPTNVVGNPNTATKVIVTAQVGPGINLPGNQRDYSVTYLYNNRDPHTYYINKNYVYYDDDRPYVYVTGPDKVVRRKYIRIGLINRYYAEFFDQFDAAERIVETFKDYYIENVVVPEIIEDYTNQVINEYTDYINSLNQRWNYDNDVNTFTVDLNDVDWIKLEEQDTILTDQDITKIYEDVQTNSESDNDESNRDSSDNSSIESASNDRDSNDESSIENASNDRDSNDEASIESASNDYTSNDNSSYDYTSNDSDLSDNSSYDNDSNNNDSNDNDNNSDNNDSSGDDTSDYDYETTPALDDDN